MPIYEVVSGQVILSKRQEFFRLHSEILLPIMKEIKIRPKLMMFTEIGRYGRFIDVYTYENLTDYESKTNILLAHPEIESYYQKIGEAVMGSIQIEIMRDLPYASDWVNNNEREN
ncbi:NIPSNAP family protein [Bacillus sp. FSL K6-0047]